MSTRRIRYYAYEARQGGVLWMDPKSHDFIQGRPHTVSHFQCKRFTGESRLMTTNEFKADREQWSRGLLCLVGRSRGKIDSKSDVLGRWPV